MDLSYIILADNPPEWKHTELDPQLIELIKPTGYRKHLPVWSAKVFTAVDMDRWYFIRNDDRLRSPAGVEAFLTKLGISWPYRGALRLYDMYEDEIEEQGSIHGAQVVFQRTVTKMRKKGRHEPITIDRAYAHWMAARNRLGGRVSDKRAEELLGPMPMRHIIDGWPVGMKGTILNANQRQVHVR